MTEVNNLKKPIIVSIFAGFVFSFLFNMIVHGIIFRDFYTETQSFWRPMPAEGEFSKYCIYSIVAMFFIVSFLSVIFTKGYKGHGPIEGVRFGLYTASLIAAVYVTFYAMIPMPFEAVTLWIASVYVEFVGLGVIFAKIHQKIKS